MDPTFQSGANPDPSFQRKAQTIEKVLKQAHIPYILACHLQIDEDLDPVPHLAYHFDANPDPDLLLMLIQMRIRIFI